MRPIDMLSLQLDFNGSPDEVIQRAIDRLSEDTKALAHISEEAAASSSYAEECRRLLRMMLTMCQELPDSVWDNGVHHDGVSEGAALAHGVMAHASAYLAQGCHEIGTGNAPFTFSEPVDSSGGPIGADVAARQWRENAVVHGFPNAEQRRYLIELLRAAKCPEPRCTDGSIISTGPDPQNDACQWCYQRHVTIEALQEGHSQGLPQPECEKWAKEPKP